MMTEVCGRYSVAVQAQEAAEELRAVLTVEALPARYNLAPTQDAPIVVERAERRLGLARFGLVPAASEGPRAAGARWINLRAEGVASQPRFAETAERRRCLVLADGFYEWKREGRHKQPYFFRAVGGGLLTFAGVWDIWQGEESLENGESEGLGAQEAAAARVPSFAVLTTRPDPLVAQIHDRMPLIVPPALRDRWLSPDEHDVRALLRAIRDAEPVALEAWKVSPRVGRVANDDAGLAAPLDDQRLVPGSPAAAQRPPPPGRDVPT
jgi:putative SOS response-associated peptidase YedK